MNTSESNPYKAPSSESEQDQDFDNVLTELGVADPRADFWNSIPFGAEAARLNGEFRAWETAHPSAENLKPAFMQYLRTKLRQRINEQAAVSHESRRIGEMMQEVVRAPLQTIVRAMKGHAVLPKPISTEDMTIEQAFNDFVSEHSLQATIRPPFPSILQKGQRVQVTWPMLDGSQKSVDGVLSDTLTYGACSYELYVDTSPTALYTLAYPSIHQYRRSIAGSITRFEERSDGSYIIYFRGFAHVPEQWLILKPL